MKKLLVSFVAAQLVIGATTAAFAFDNPARDAAMNMMRQKDYNGALNKLDEAVGFSATDPENFMLRGKCFFVMRNYQLAIEDFNHVINLSPNFYRAFLWRGTAQARLGADQLAISDYSQAIQLQPQLANSFFSAKGGASSLPGHATGASGPAIEDYKRAMGQAYPKGFDAGSAPPAGAQDTDEFSDFGDASGYRGLPAQTVQPAGTAELRVGAKDGATVRGTGDRRVSNVYDTDPNISPMGCVPGSEPLQGDPQEVLKDTTEALRMDTTNPDYYFERAKAYQALSQANKAFDDYSEAIRLFPKAKYYVGRASLFDQLNKPMLVNADIRSAVAADPTTPRQITFSAQKYPSSVRWDGDGPPGK